MTDPRLANAVSMWATASACNERTREYALDLLDLIRHRVREGGPCPGRCEKCVRIYLIGWDDDPWPWRDYSSDDPKAADPEYVAKQP